MQPERVANRLERRIAQWLATCKERRRCVRGEPDASHNPRMQRSEIKERLGLRGTCACRLTGGSLRPASLARRLPGEGGLAAVDVTATSVRSTAQVKQAWPPIWAHNRGRENRLRIHTRPNTPAMATGRPRTHAAQNGKPSHFLSATVVTAMEQTNTMGAITSSNGVTHRPRSLPESRSLLTWSSFILR